MGYQNLQKACGCNKGTWIVIIVLVSLLVFMAVFFAVQDIPSSSCTYDEECNRGKCSTTTSKCECDHYYFHGEIDGMIVPCIHSYNDVYPAGNIIYYVSYIAAMLCILIINITVIFALSTEAKKKTSWQVDSRFCIGNLALGNIASIIWTAFYIKYNYGDDRSIKFEIAANLARVFYLESGTAVILYWWFAVTAASGKSREFHNKHPLLIYSLLFYLLCWAIPNFIGWSGRESVRNAALYFNIVFGVVIIPGFISISLWYLGRKIISMLAPKQKSSTVLIEKISFFLNLVALFIFTDVAVVVLNEVEKGYATPRGYTLYAFAITLLEVLANCAFLAIYAGGSLKRIGLAIIWVWRRHPGTSPMADALPRNLFRKASSSSFGVTTKVSDDSKSIEDGTSTKVEERDNENADKEQTTTPKPRDGEDTTSPLTIQASTDTLLKPES